MADARANTQTFTLHKQRSRSGLAKVETVGRGYFTFDKRDHKALFWVADRVVAELHHAELEEAVVDGLRMRGFEPVDPDGKRYGVQEWWLRYEA